MIFFRHITQYYFHIYVILIYLLLNIAYFNDIFSSLHPVPCYIHTMSKFWDRVKVLMSAPTVVDLANQLEVKRSTLSSWLHTDRRPPMSVLLKISEKTGVTIEQLEYGLDYKLLDEEEAAEDIPSCKKELKMWIDDLQARELFILRPLISYLRNQSLERKP